MRWEMLLSLGLVLVGAYSIARPTIRVGWEGQEPLYVLQGWSARALGPSY